MSLTERGDNAITCIEALVEDFVFCVEYCFRRVSDDTARASARAAALALA